jgi:hypothetical protein
MLTGLIHVQQTAIAAGVFKSHIMQTHPSIDRDTLPPDHTIVID